MLAYTDAGVCLQGLNQGSNASTQDLAYVMRRMKALGFNTIKLYLLNGLTPPRCVPRRI